MRLIQTVPRFALGIHKNQPAAPRAPVRSSASSLKVSDAGGTHPALEALPSWTGNSTRIDASVSGTAVAVLESMHTCLVRNRAPAAVIDHLTAVRDLMNGSSPAEAPRRPGRPKGSSKKTLDINLDELVTKKKRSMSAEGKARVAEAQRKRWAAQKRKPAKKVARIPANPVRKSAPVAKRAAKPAVRSTSAKVAPKKPSLPVQTRQETPAGTE